MRDRWIDRPAMLLLSLAVALACGCSGDSQDDDDDDSADPELTEVDLPLCLDDLDCPYLFACGHRGTTMFAPENTLLGFETVLTMGVEMVEIDVRPTADEVLILMHDSSVDRTTDGTGEVDELTLDQIRELSVVSTFEGIDNQPVPTFAEFLEAFGGRTLVNIDAKTTRYDLIAADIAAADARDWCLVQVASIEEAQAMRLADPAIRLMPDVETVEDVDLYADAVAPELVELPWQNDQSEPVDRATERGARSQQDALGPADAAALVHEANGDDICAAFDPILATGVTVVQTDVPHLLVPCLQASNAAHGYQHTPQ